MVHGGDADGDGKGETDLVHTHTHRPTHTHTPSLLVQATPGAVAHRDGEQQIDKAQL